MSNSYAPMTPRGKDNNPKYDYPPAKVALATTHKDNAAASSVLLFTHNTTEIEVAATGGPVVGKWATSTANNGTSVIALAGTANFDFVVPAAQVRRFVVPIQTFAPSTASVQGVNRAEGLYQGVAYIQGGPAASVMTMEF